MQEIGREQIEINRIGAMRLTAQFLAESRTEAIRQVPLEMEGLLRTQARITPWRGNDGEYLVDAIYEGLDADPDPSQDEYQLFTEERETKIENFAPREVLVETFGATVDAEGRLKFPPTLPKPKNRIGQPLTLDTYRNGQTAETQNPLHNTTTYGVPHTTAIWRLIRKKVPAALENQARQVIDRLPAGFDYQGPKAQWYVRPLQKRKIGNAWEIEWQAFEISEFSDLTVLATLQSRDRRGRGAGQGLLVTGL